MQRPYGQCKGRTVDAGLYGQCRAAWAKAFHGALFEGLRVCSRCSPLPGPCKPDLFAPFLAILTNLRVTAGAISAGGDLDRVLEVRGDSGPTIPRVIFVSPEGEAFVQSFMNLQDFAQSSVGSPTLPILRNDDYNGPVTQAGISFTQMNVGTGATSFVAPVQKESSRCCFWNVHPPCGATHKAKSVLKSQVSRWYL